MNISERIIQPDTQSFSTLQKGSVKETEGSPALINDANKLITQAAEGEVFQGKIVDITNDKVQILLGNNQTLQARMEQAVSLNIGDELQFLVKENNGQSVYIKPVSEQQNAFKDSALSKILEQNNLSPSVKNYQIADSLMNHNMPVDRNSMQKVMQQSYKFPDAPIDNIVNMNKLGIPVNEGNLNQYQDMLNNNHQLAGNISDFAKSVANFVAEQATGLENNNIDADTLKQNIDTILKTVSDEADMPSEEFKAELDSANQPGNADMNNGVGRQNEIDSSLGRQGAVNQSGTDRQNAVNDLKQQVTANQADSNLDSVKQADNGADKQNVVKDLKQPNTVNQMENEASKQNSVNQPANNEQKNVTGTANNGMGQEQVSLKQNGEKIEQSTLNQPSFTESISKSISEKLSLDKNNVENLIGKLQDAGVSADKLELLSEKSDTPMQLVNNINELVKSLSQTSERKAADIIKSKDFQTLFSTALNKKFSIDAEKTGNPKELSDLYKSLYEKAEKLLNSFQMDSGSAGEQMKDSGRSMQERIDFVQNLNELFSYAQIPVNISGNETNSELFVYMNKGKKLDISKEVSALLHLDMDHLGATDVHVSLSGSVVHTRFYVDDEESANIIDQHMTMLEKAINSAGYSLTNETVTRNQSINSTGNKVVDELLGKDLEQSIKRYSFDVKM